MKYSKRFNEDYNLYLRLKDIYNFAPFDVTKGKQPITNNNNYTAKEVFYYFDSQGKLFDTNELDLVLQLLICKSSINFHIKMYAQTRAEGTLSYKELLDIQKEYQLPQWFVDAVEKQKSKLINNYCLLK